MPVQTFCEAFHEYYGEALGKKLRHLSCRKLLQSGIVLAAATYLPALFSGFRSMGDMYYRLEQYRQAEQYSRRGVEMFDNENANWSYQTCRQNLGRDLIGVRDYDNAYELPESTSNSVVLQSPYYQARSLRTLSDFFLAIGEREQGMELAENAHNLCAQYGFTGQQRMLANMLARYR